MRKTRARPTPVRSGARQAPRPWPQILAERVLLLLVVTVPIIINTYSKNFLDVKDATLGIGVAVGLFLWLIAGLAQGRLSWVRSRLSVVVLAYFLWAGVSVAYSGAYWFVTLSEFGRLAANAGVFFLALVCLRSMTQVRRVIWAAWISAIPVSIYAFMQATGHDFIKWTDPVVRVHSFLGNSTYLGGYCSLLIPFVALLAWPARAEGADKRRLSWLVPALAGVVIVMLMITLFLSFTLAAIIGLGLGMIPVLVLLVLREGRKATRKAGLILAVAALVGAPVAYVVYQHMPAAQQGRVQKVIRLQDPASGERQLHWRTAYRLFQERPVLGWGYGAYRVNSLELMAGEWYGQRATRTAGMLAPGYAHNEPLQVLADTGIVGGVLFLALVVLVYVMAFRVALRHPDRGWRRIGLAAAATVTGFLFQNLVGVTFHQSGTVTFFWLWLALLVVAEGHLPRREEAAQEEMGTRELRFRRRPGAAVLAAVVAACVVGMIAWATIRPAIANVTVRKAQTLAGLGRYQEAVAAANKTLELCPYSPIAYYTLAFAYGNLGDYDRALKANQTALQLMPGNGSALYNLGIVYKQMGRLGLAAETFRKAIAVMPSAGNYIALAEALLAQGQMAEAEVQAKKAAELAAKAPEEESRRAQFYLFLAEIAYRRKDPEGMLAYTRKAVEVQPADVKAQASLIRMLLSLKRDRETVEAARAWIAVDPSAAQAHFGLGIAQYNLKDFGGAKEHLSRAVELDPSDLTARLYLAYTLGKTGDLAGYRRELQRVAEAGGDSAVVATARKQLGVVAPAPAPR